MTGAKEEVIKEYKIVDLNIKDVINISFAKLNGKSVKNSFFEYYIEDRGVEKIFVIKI